MRALRAVWNSYLTLQKGGAISELHSSFLQTPAKGRAEASSKQACRVVVINSGRLADVSMLARAVAEKDKLQGRAHASSNLLFVDTCLSGSLTQRSALRKLTVWLAVRYSFTFFVALLGTGSFGCSVIALYRRWIQRENIETIELFSSNSRFIECLRIAAILEGRAVTEFLHGICSDAFGQFYEILDDLARQSGATLHYINMLPTLPQPPAIDRHLVRHHNVQAYFVNEKAWAPRHPEAAFDVLIVGGETLDGNYLESTYFRSEMAAADECLSAGYSVVYCAHPAQRNRVAPHVPTGAARGTLAEHVNSAGVIVGHYSTALFNAKIIGHEVLIFESDWLQIPDALAALFANRAASTYSLSRVAAAVAAATKRGRAPSLPNGINLIQDFVS